MPKKIELDELNPDDYDGEDVCEAIMQMKQKIDHLVSAFPAGDMDGHRRYHELQIARVEEIRRLRVAIQEKTIAGLVWAGMLWLGTIALHNIQDYLKGVIH